MQHKKNQSQLAPPEVRGYQELVIRISSFIEEGRHYAVRQINTALIATYWATGCWIVKYEQRGSQRAEYGKTLLKRLGKDLSHKYGRGFSERNLEQMRLFYQIYPISQTVSAKFLPTSESFQQHFPLSWSHYCCLMRIKEKVRRDFYEAVCLKGNWSFRQLDRQIQGLLFERTALSRQKQIVISKAHNQNIIQCPEDAIKEHYVLDFLNLRDDYSESDLEDALIKHLENFLLELGERFTFVARQKRFMVGGKYYRIDLLLYHRILRCLVLIDLKIGEFNHADAGQMNFYLNWAKHEAILPGENEPVGIILCAGKDKTYVQYALGDLSNKIFVSNYKLKLPKAEELRKEVRRGRNLFLDRKPSARPGATEPKNVEGKPS